MLYDRHLLTVFLSIALIPAPIPLDEVQLAVKFWIKYHKLTGESLFASLFF